MIPTQKSPLKIQNFLRSSHLLPINPALKGNLMLPLKPFLLHFSDLLQASREVPISFSFSSTSRSNWNPQTKGEFSNGQKSLHVFAQDYGLKVARSIFWPSCRWWTLEIEANFAWFLNRCHKGLLLRLQKAKPHIRTHRDRHQVTISRQDCYIPFQGWYQEPYNVEYQ